MANTFNLGNGNWAQKTEKLLAYNAENDNYKPLPFDFDRASTATRVNKQGLIETVGTDEPRIDFTDNTKGHLLLEPSRTNLLIQSVNLASIFVFNAGGGTLTANYGVSPDGSKTSTRVIANDTNNSHCFEAISGGSGSFTYSLYYKGVIGETTTIRAIAVGSGGVSAEKSITFTGKWQREQITFQRGATANYVYIVDYRSINGTATDFQVFGAQLETGSYATSYIPTSGSAVTRVYDTMPTYQDITKLNIGNSYTLFLDADLNVNDNNKVFSVINNSSDVTSFTFRNNGGGIRLYNHIDASYPVSGISSANNKFVIRVDGNSYKVFGQGSSLSGTLTTQRDVGYLNFYGQNTELKINNFTIDNTALSDAECELLVN